MTFIPSVTEILKTNTPRCSFLHLPFLQTQTTQPLHKARNELPSWLNQYSHVTSGLRTQAPAVTLAALDSQAWWYVTAATLVIFMQLRLLTLHDTHTHTHPYNNPYVVIKDHCGLAVTRQCLIARNLLNFLPTDMCFWQVWKVIDSCSDLINSSLSYIVKLDSSDYTVCVRQFNPG